MKDPTKDHSRVTPEGRAAGFQVAMRVEPAVAALVREGEPDERCKSCAGTYGTVPNGCIVTQADLIKPVVEDVPFMCHQADRKGRLCHAWFALRWVSKGGKGSCPWEFSPPDEPAKEG